MGLFIVIALVLHALDLVITLIGLRLGLIEVGAVAGLALNMFGLLGLAVIPLVGLAVQGAVIRWLLPRRFRLAGYSLVVGLLFIPVTLNLVVVVVYSPR